MPLLYNTHSSLVVASLQDLSSGHHDTHHHRNVRILRISCSFHVPSDDISVGVRDAQHFHFITKVRPPQVDHCLLSQQYSCLFLSRNSSHLLTSCLRPVPCAPQHFHIQCLSSE
ncbi:hypothetical protein PoB_003341200 [Plakobranchus ocellatus]|uniref:Uncharacterized protein n=1 Tax=Plakobranchus ocellatus TaxID=259542 RepID=A0AAV4AI34_9GAST|nr:hypothetical protein PoB_003341200 [Plakobranchus ocellatus]